MKAGKTAKQIRTDDKKRKTRLENLTGKPVYLLWEKDIYEKGIAELVMEVLEKHETH